MLLAALAVVFGWYYLAWKRVGRDPEKGVIIPRYRPPAGLSPAACRYVLSMSLKQEAFVAAIVSLAVKGLVEIEEEKKDFTLRRLHVALHPVHAGVFFLRGSYIGRTWAARNGVIRIVTPRMMLASKCPCPGRTSPRVMLPSQ